jgi:GNAT superfamily N-acetyltransferase
MPTDGDAVEIRLFNPQTHDRAAFDCGVGRLNNFLQRSAKKQQKGDFVRVYVAIAPGQGRVLGYHSINAYGLAADDLGPLAPKAAPSHGTVPAIYLSMIAVDLSQQGRGLGSILLDHAKRKALGVADTLGAWAIVLDVMEEGGSDAVQSRLAWYGKHGFIPFPSAPLKIFLPIATIRATYGG